MNSAQWAYAFMFAIKVTFPLGAFLLGVKFLISISPWYRELRSKDETVALQNELAASPPRPSAEELYQHVFSRVCDQYPEPRDAILDGIYECIKAIYALEYDDENEPPPVLHNSEEGRGYRLRLSARIRRRSDPGNYLALRDAVTECMVQFVAYLPPVANKPRVPGAVLFNGRIGDLLFTQLGSAVSYAVSAFWSQDCVGRAVCNDIRMRFDDNRSVISQRALSKAAFANGEVLQPQDYEGAPDELLHGYLQNLPLLSLFTTNFGFELPQAQRLEHTVIVGASGHGKSQLLEILILWDLSLDDPPGLVVIDSKGDMVDRIAKLACFHPETGRLRDRLIILDPRDRPALNLFDVNMEQLRHYDEVEREQVMNGVISTYEYFFGSLLGAELTSKMSVIFRPLVQLMLHIPAADIHTLIGALDDISPYKDIVAQLPKGARRFLENEYQDKSYGDTKTQVKRRLYQMVQSETFDRMFSAPKNQIDFAEALNQGKIILINADRPYLQDYSPIFGRYFISLTINAALRRAAIPDAARKVSYVYIDEAAAYFDEKTDQLLTTLRSYKLGATFAFQYLGQASEALRASMMVNTSVKFMGGVEGDAKIFASAMHTTPEYIQEQTKDGRDPPRFTRFATYIRNAVPEAFSFQMALGTLEEQETMDAEAYARLRGRNRQYVSGQLVDIGNGADGQPRVFYLTITSAQALVGMTCNVLLPEGPAEVRIPPGVKDGTRLHVGRTRSSDGNQSEAFVVIRIDDAPGTGPSALSKQDAIPPGPIVRLHRPDLPWKLDRTPGDPDTKPADW